jgi:hypothetical protein
MKVHVHKNAKEYFNLLPFMFFHRVGQEAVVNWLWFRFEFSFEPWKKLLRNTNF